MTYDVIDDIKSEFTCDIILITIIFHMWKLTKKIIAS